MKRKFYIAAAALAAVDTLSACLTAMGRAGCAACAMLCALAVTVDHFRLQIEFGERECRLFETARESFPREEIQWLFDTAVWKNGKKLLQIDPSSLVSFELLFRLLAIKRIPDEDHFSLYYDFRR